MNQGAEPGPPWEGAITRAFRERVRATPPDLLPGHDGLPSLPPQIPGLADLVAVKRGGTGIVYRARATATGETVAVKVLPAAEALSPSARARARREGEILAHLDHPNIVRVLSTGELHSCPGWPDGVPYLVMEWLPGGTLQRLSGEHALPAREAARLIRDLARVLAEVHARGIVHRDLKPANVMLVAGGGADGRLVPKLVDFGLARHEMVAAGLTPSSGVIGTPEYMAPEQAGVNDLGVMVSPATDIHGLGGILFFLLFGRAPYGAKTVPEAFARVVAGDVDWPTGWTQRIPLDLRTILERCLERLPGRRYLSAGALADDLDRLVEGRPIQARRTPWPERLVRWARRRPAGAMGAILTAVMLVSAAFGLWGHRARLNRARDAGIAAQELSRASLVGLTDESIERMLSRGRAFDETDLAFLRRVRDLYRHWPLEPDRRDSLGQRVKALERLASIFARINWIDDAAECYQAAREDVAALARLGMPPERASRVRFELLRTEAAMLTDAGRTAEAVEPLEQALALAASWPPGRSAVDDASSPMVQIELATVLGRNGDGEAADGLVDDALVALARAREAWPDDPFVAHEELTSLFNAAGATASIDRRRHRLGSILERADSVKERFPSLGSEVKKISLLAMATLVDVELQTGHHEAALDAVHRLKALVDVERAGDPDNAFLRGEAIEAAIRESEALVALGRPDESAPVLAEAVAMARQSHSAEPAVMKHFFRSIKALRAQALLHRRAGRPTEAIATCREIIEAFGPWHDAPLQDEPKAHLKAWEAGAHAEIGRILLQDLDRPAEAAESLRRALDLQPMPGRPDWMLALAEAALAAGDLAAAREAAQAAAVHPPLAARASALLERIPD